MKTIIMVLGAPNDEYGHLSAIALDRLYRAYDLAINNESAWILCTGGQGDHFNITDKPHTYYAQNGGKAMSTYYVEAQFHMELIDKTTKKPYAYRIKVLVLDDDLSFEINGMVVI